MPDAVIVSTARTPLCKSWRGAFNMTHGATLGGHALRHAIDRAGVDPAEIEDVIVGCANPEGATGRNIARQIALRAGCPVTTAGLIFATPSYVVSGRMPSSWLTVTSLIDSAPVFLSTIFIFVAIGAISALKRPASRAALAFR